MKATGNYLLLHEKDESLHKHFADLLGPIMQVPTVATCLTTGERAVEDLDFQCSNRGFFRAMLRIRITSMRMDPHNFNSDPDPVFYALMQIRIQFFTL